MKGMRVSEFRRSRARLHLEHCRYKLEAVSMVMEIDCRCSICASCGNCVE